MARPVKNYCEYFSHDRDMRNHRKIKAVRNKFGIAGYAIWSMMLEYLTGIDGNVMEHSEPELELISGDFGVSVTEISEVLDYCIKLGLLSLENGFIRSESLDDRLKSVYDKRGQSKTLSEKQRRDNGKFATNNAVANGVSVTEMPQSKVKESKVKESIPIERKFLIPEMFKVFKTKNTTYPGDIDKDFNPLGNISRFIEKQMPPNSTTTVLKEWEILCDVIMDDGFYKMKSLSVISNQIQEIYQIKINGKPIRTNGSKANSGSLAHVGKTITFDQP